jgi:hypothetical protein
MAVDANTGKDGEFMYRPSLVKRSSLQKRLSTPIGEPVSELHFHCSASPQQGINILCRRQRFMRQFVVLFKQLGNLQHHVIKSNRAILAPRP